MSQALRQQIDNLNLDTSLDQSPKFQVYREHETATVVQFQELIFFAQLSSFCILTVMFSFLFLANQFPTLIALPLAAGLGAGTTVLTKTLITKLINKTS